MRIVRPLLLMCSLLATATPVAAAIDIGVTSAVRPDATGTAPGEPTRILQVGQDVLANQRIDTDTRGQTHLLFRDGSALTIGPNASMVLDTFVYDPVAKDGKLVVSVSKGLFRFVGGRLSKKKPVLFKTPTATIGIRGGVAMMQIGDSGAGQPSSVTMLYGDEVFMDNGESRQTMNRPGFVVTQQPGGGLVPPAPATPEQLNGSLASLEEPVPAPESEDGTALGEIEPAAGGPAVSDQDVSDSQISGVGSANAPEAVAPQQSSPQAGGSTTQLHGTQVATNEATEASQQQMAQSPSAPSESAQEETASSGGPASTPQQIASNAGPVSTPQQIASDSGIPVSTADRSPTEAAAEPVAAGTTLGAVGGRGRCCESNATGTADTLSASNFRLSNASVTDGVLTATGPNGSFTLRFPGAGESNLTAADATGVIFEQFGAVQAGSVFVSDSGDFAAYELRSDSAGSLRGLVVAGTPTPAASIPTAGFSTFDLLDDFTIGNAPAASLVPFVDDIASSAIAADSAKAYVAWNKDPESGHRAFAIGRVVVIGQTGASQESGAAVIAGSVDLDEGSPHYIDASMRGSSREVAAFAGNQHFFGTAASLPTANNEHFYGGDGPEDFLLGAGIADNGNEPTADPVNHKTGGTTAATDLYPNTVAVNGSHSATAPNGTRSEQTLRGYAGGLFVQYGIGSTAIAGTDRLIAETSGTNAPGLVISTDPAANRIDARLDGQNDYDSFRLTFGGLGASGGDSAFIDDKIFVATEDTTDRGYVSEFQIAQGTGYFTTAHDLQTTGFIPDGVSLCTCSYLTWGFLGVDFANANTEQQDQSHLAVWAAGTPVTNAGQFPSGYSATYEGHVWGTVYDGSKTYQAVGALSLSVTAGNGAVVTVDSGSISNFDGGTYSLTDATGGYEVVPAQSFHANATLVSRAGSSPGEITGEFVGNFFGPGSMPENIAGNFWLNRSPQVEASPYQAAGIGMAQQTTVEQ